VQLVADSSKAGSGVRRGLRNVALSLLVVGATALIPWRREQHEDPEILPEPPVPESQSGFGTKTVTVVEPAEETVGDLAEESSEEGVEVAVTGTRRGWLARARRGPADAPPSEVPLEDQVDDRDLDATLAALFGLTPSAPAAVVPQPRSAEPEPEPEAVVEPEPEPEAFV